MKKLLIVLFLSLSAEAFAQNVTITGQITGTKSPATVDLEDISAQRIIQTDSIINSKFQIKSPISKDGFYRLVFGEKSYLLLVLHPNTSIKIKVDLENLLEPEITGSDENKAFYIEIAALGVISHIEDSIEQVFNSNYGLNDTVAAQAVMHYQMMEMQKKLSMQNFLQQYSGYLASLYFTEQLSVDTDFGLFKIVAEKLKEKFPKNEYVLNLESKVEKAKKMAIGAIAPEIELNSPEGKQIRLSALRGKYVLIDFWASWCGPCRRESPNMVAIYNKYHKKGFDIYSVSLDKDSASWTNAITVDGLGQWKHVSDLKYWNSVAAKEYGVEAIPFTLLLDKEGKIIAKNLRGKDLEQKITELLN